MASSIIVTGSIEATPAPTGRRSPARHPHDPCAKCGAKFPASIHDNAISCWVCGHRQPLKQSPAQILA